MAIEGAKKEGGGFTYSSGSSYTTQTWLRGKENVFFYMIINIQWRINMSG